MVMKIQIDQLMTKTQIIINLKFSAVTTAFISRLKDFIFEFS